MSLFSKLFNKRKNSTVKNHLADQEHDVFKEWAEQEPCGPTIPFEESQVRLIVIRESELRGRQVLFDSAAVKVLSRKPGNPSNGKPEFRRNAPISKPETVPRPASSPVKTLDQQRQNVAQTIRCRSDVKMLGEMIFGSIPITVRSVITKVHELRSPSQLMLTKIHPVFVPAVKDGEEEEPVAGSRLSESRSSWSSDDSISINSPPGMHLSIPDRLVMRKSGSIHRSATSPSLTPSHSSSSLSSLTFSPPKLSMHPSYIRRYFRNRSTSIDNGVKGLLELENAEQIPDGHTRAKKSVIAITCLIGLPETDGLLRESFQEFFFTHTPMFEYSLGIFKANLEVALSNREKFTELILSAYDDFVQQLIAFITAPRLPHPMWLIIALEKCSDESYIPVLRLRLVDTLYELTRRFDSKETQYFLSRLVTAVLTGHLGWVSTVTPSDFQADTYKQKHEPDWAQPLAKSHPYNPLWAQLGDLMGICGTPPRLTKTVLVSKNPILLSAFLHFLSYLIRTSDVGFHRFEPVTQARPADLFSAEPARTQRNHSGDSHRAGGTLHKLKRMSGSRSRLPSCDEESMVHGIPANGSFGDLEHESPEIRPRRMTADSMYRTFASNKSLTGLSAAASQSSIAEESAISSDADTDEKQLRAVSMVASQIHSIEKQRRSAYSLNPDSAERHLGERRSSLKQFSTTQQKLIRLSKSPDKPLILHLQEQPIARFRANVIPQKFADAAFENCSTFAKSLLSSPLENYVPHFALQGCQNLDMEKLGQDLMVAAENSLTDEESNEASAVVADLDNFTVKVLTCSARKSRKGVTVPSKDASGSGMCRSVDCQASAYVIQVLETVSHLWSLKTTPEFCLMHLEDRLQELYVSSRTMVSFINYQNTVDTREMMELLGMDLSDFPLILAVASTHSPEVISELNLA